MPRNHYILENINSNLKFRKLQMFRYVLYRTRSLAQFKSMMIMNSCFSTIGNSYLPFFRLTFNSLSKINVWTYSSKMISVFSPKVAY